MVKNPPGNVGNAGCISGSGRSPGEGNNNPLQYSCLENPMDSGAWWATVYGVAESDTTEVAKYACTFFTVLEPGSPRSRHQHGHMLLKAFLFFWLIISAFLLRPHMVEAGGKLPGATFIKA